jgi:hypothetical protein
VFTEHAYTLWSTVYTTPALSRVTIVAPCGRHRDGTRAIAVSVPRPSEVAALIAAVATAVASDLA